MAKPTAKRPAKRKTRTRKANGAATGAFLQSGFAFGLAEVIHPITPASFFRTYWEKKPLVVNRRKPNYYHDLLTLDNIDQVITSMNLPYPEIELVNAKEQIERGAYTRNNSRIDVAKLYDLFADGATVILPHLHIRLPSLASFCRAMEQEFSMPYQTNIYLTPANSQGFKSHYDTHDVFILQVAGTKDWRIYDAPVALPHRGQRFDVNETPVGEVTQEFKLRPGDMVYIPRGIMHDAGSQKGTSLHITTGVLAYTWTDLMLEAVSAVSLKNPDLRRSLPVGFARAGYRRNKAKAEFKELVRKFARTADFDDALDQFADRITSSRAPLLRGQMEQVTRLDRLNLKTLAGPRPALIYKLFRDGDRIVISVYGKEIAFPKFAAPSLRHALSAERYRIGDLPGDLDDDGKITLVGRLVREGLVAVMPD
ncbi:MAG: hypothetical protein O7A03_06675 [Alphaproteobacteria bacterium]|nr:hypothetical protein [Alphaproteobacteria bacterium]